MKERYPLFELDTEGLIKKYWDEYSPLDDGFLCFQEDYEDVYYHLKNLKNIEIITDIGCAWGVQNLFFKEYRYIGISEHAAVGETCLKKSEGLEFKGIKIPFFREGEGNVNYYVARFPKGLKSEMIGDVFISNMSVGYQSIESLNLDEIVKGYLKFHCGYLRSIKEINERVIAAFPYHEVVRESQYSWDSPLYFVSN